MEKVFKIKIFRTTLIYIILTGLWISCSDWVLSLFVSDSKQIIVISVIKGWLYIIVTATILYFHIMHDREIRLDQELLIRQAKTELDLQVQIRTSELQTIIKELEAFSYSVSHDLRAPLRTIEGYDRMLLEDYIGKLDENGTNYLHRLHETDRSPAAALTGYPDCT